MRPPSILPIEDYTIISALSVDEIRKRISESIKATYTTDFRMPYHGEVSPGGFRIRRNIRYQNSFLPVITGQFSGISGWSEIRILMRPEKTTLVIMYFWFGILSLICIIILANWLLLPHEAVYKGSAFASCIPFLMFLFGWGLMFFAFKYESRKSKQFLLTLLEARPAEESLT